MCLWHDVKLRKTQLEVRSINVTWSRDLWCHRVIVFFWKCVKLLSEQLWQIWRPYAPLFFFAICKKPEWGVDIRPRARVNPRPAWVWLVTRPAGWGGGQRPPPPEISQTTEPISKFQTPFDSPVRELPVQGQKFDPEVTDDVTGQVKVRIFDFSDLVTSASKISMLSANKANESAWIMSLTSVSIISCAL